VKDRVLTSAQFAELEEQQAWRDGHARREKRRDNRTRRRKVEEAILEAKARELGVPLVLCHPEIRPSLPYRVHAAEVNDEIALNIDMNGHYAYVTLARRGAYRGRFTPEEVHLLVEQLRAVRLPYRKPHVSKSRKRRA